MTCYLIYTRNTPGERAMQSLALRLDEFAVPLELIDADTRRGTGLVESYDVLARPAIMVTRDDGSLVELWTEEERFPRPADLAHMVQAG